MKIKTLIRTATVLALYLPALFAQSTVTWEGTANQNWSDGGNWTDGVPTGDDVVFNNTDTTTEGVVNNIVDSSITINSLAYQQDGGARQVTEIADGATLTLNGINPPFPGNSTRGTEGAPTADNIFRVGTQNGSSDGATVAGLASDVEITGAGSFVVNASSYNFLVSSFTTTTQGGRPSLNAPTSLDMSGLADFSADVNQFNVGLGRASNATVHLAESNLVTTNSMIVGASYTSANLRASPSLSTVYLGQENTLNTTTLNIGAGSNRNAASGTLVFADDLVGATVTLRGKNGTDRVTTMQLGNINTSSSDEFNANVTTTGIADFTGGSVDAMVGTLTIGTGRPGGGIAEGIGHLMMNAGTFDATTVNVGFAPSGTSGNGLVQGTLDIDGGDFIAGSMSVGIKATETNSIRSVGTVNVSGGTLSTNGNITMGNNGRETALNEATLNITGGAVTVDGNIEEGATGGEINTSAVVLSGGSLDMTGGTVTVDTFTLESGTLSNLGEFNTAGAGVGNLEKTTAGTLILGGTNTYTGETNIAAGTLALSSGASIASSAGITVANGASLDVTGLGTLNLVSGQYIGGAGNVNGNLHLESGAQFVFDPNFVDSNALEVFGNLSLDSTFGVDSLVAADGSAIDWSGIGNNSYTLLDTSFVFNDTNISNFGEENAYNIGGGRSAYFSEGSLVLNVIPEPGTFAMLMVGFGVLLASQFSRRRVRK